MSEHIEQREFLRWTEIYDRRFPQLARFFAVPMGGLRNKVVAGKLRAEGARKGILDMFNLTPSVSREGGIYYGLIFEFKVGRNKLTPEQEDWKAYFEAQGFRVEVPRSWIEAALYTVDYFCLPDELTKELPIHRVKGHLAVRRVEERPA